MSTKPTRRSFLVASGAGLTALAATGPILSTANAAPSERVRVAVFGMGSQGRAHARGFDGMPDCEVVAVCDLDPERRAQAAAELSEPTRVRQVEDFRSLLDDPEIDAVSIASPDHWHTPMALAALKAGKHVYLEKPCSHNVYESHRLVDAAHKTGLCVQHGTQARSGDGIQQAIQFMREGGIGTVRAAKAINHQLRRPIGRAPVSDPPAGVNYDLWMGPAPAHPFTANRWHYNWHWYWDYGTGDMGNDGIHEIDVARWGLGVGVPHALSASGGQLFYDDDHETPDTQIVTFEYPNCYLIYEMRLWTEYKLEGHDNGTIFYGDNGILEVGRPGCEVTLIGEEKRRIGGGRDFDGHLRNFIDCIKADTPEALNAPIGDGAISANLTHYGNIATRLSRRLEIDPATGDIRNDSEARAMLQRDYRSGYELPEV